MVERMIEYLVARKAKLKEEANKLNDLVNIFSERDELAASIYYRKLQLVNEEYLELDMKLQEAEAALPPELPDTAPLFI
jgi:chromosome segregation ATPase